jgi:arylsulfatase A-like enzyme
VIFISDHAVHLGEKEHWWKMTLWLQTTHIPFLMRVPGISKEGVRTNAPVDMTALYPTVLSVLNLPSTGLKLDGEPLTPLLENPNTPWNKAAVTTSGFKNHSVVTENWRYIQYSDGGEELYNKKTDSLEFKNLIWTPSGKTQYASTVNQLKAFLPKVNLADVCKIGGWDCPAPPEE